MAVKAFDKIMDALIDRLAWDQELYDALRLQSFPTRIRGVGPGSRAPEASETLSAGARAGLELLDPCSRDQDPGEEVANA